MNTLFEALTIGVVEGLTEDQHREVELLEGQLDSAMARRSNDVDHVHVSLSQWPGNVVQSALIAKYRASEISLRFHHEDKAVILHWKPQ